MEFVFYIMDFDLEPASNCSSPREFETQIEPQSQIPQTVINNEPWNRISHQKYPKTEKQLIQNRLPDNMYRSFFACIQPGSNNAGGAVEEVVLVVDILRILPTTT
jgi:hypothetical protein